MFPSPSTKVLLFAAMAMLSIEVVSSDAQILSPIVAGTPGAAGGGTPSVISVTGLAQGSGSSSNVTVPGVTAGNVFLVYCRQGIPTTSITGSLGETFFAKPNLTGGGATYGQWMSTATTSSGTDTVTQFGGQYDNCFIVQLNQGTYDNSVSGPSGSGTGATLTVPGTSGDLAIVFVNATCPGNVCNATMTTVANPGWWMGAATMTGTTYPALITFSYPQNLEIIGTSVR